MQTKRSLLGVIAATGLLLAAATASGDEAASRSGYSYIRMMTGDATVATRWNGSVEARRNMPISVGDEISVSQGGRVEIGLADGNALYLGGGSHATFDSLSDQQGEEDQFSAIRLSDGDAVLAAMGSSEEEIPRIDTDDATIYLAAGAHVRVNSDPRRGTVVIARAGTAQVRTRTGTYDVKAGQYLMARARGRARDGPRHFLARSLRSLGCGPPRDCRGSAHRVGPVRQRRVRRRCRRARRLRRLGVRLLLRRGGLVSQGGHGLEPVFLRLLVLHAGGHDLVVQ